MNQPITATLEMAEMDFSLDLLAPQTEDIHCRIFEGGLAWNSARSLPNHTAPDHSHPNSKLYAYFDSGHLSKLVKFARELSNANWKCNEVGTRKKCNVTSYLQE